MKSDKLKFLKLLGSIFIMLFIIFFSIESTVNGIHEYDTYFIMNKALKLILYVVISLFTGSLLASIFTKFRNKFYVKTLAFSALL
jgi:hypothetical protein